jgi:hypothetical protein
VGDCAELEFNLSVVPNEKTYTHKNEY